MGMTPEPHLQRTSLEGHAPYLLALWNMGIPAVSFANSVSTYPIVSGHPGLDEVRTLSHGGGSQKCCREKHLHNSLKMHQ